MLTILSLCDYSGTWSKPYADAGYDVIQVDLKHGADVRLFRALPFPVRGVLAAPPCNHFSSSGARYWQAKGDEAILEGMAVVDACLRVIMISRPQWWCLENPVGRLKEYLGEPRMTFQPSDYGDPYTKRTLLWGDFNPPLMRNRVEARDGSRIATMPDSVNREVARSTTPEGFAAAFFKANP